MRLSSEDGLCLRFLSIQLLERPSVTEDVRLELREVEVEGWARSCGELAGSARPLTDSLCPGSLCLRSGGQVGGLGPGLHQWHRVRHVPRGATWHPARDKLRSVEVISLQPPSVLDCQQSHNYHVSPILRPSQPTLQLL